MRSVLLCTLGLVLLTGNAFGADVTKGKIVYDSRCSFCHGVGGKGDGPAGTALQPQPTNFTDPSYWKRAQPSGIRLMIVNGKPGTAMVPFGQTLKADEVDDVVAYINTFK